MTEQEAFDILQKKYPDKVIKSVVDYEALDLYVFNAVPADKVNTPMVDTLYSVDRSTGKIRGFQPMQHSPDRYFEAVDKSYKEYVN